MGRSEQVCTYLPRPHLVTEVTSLLSLGGIWCVSLRSFHGSLLSSYLERLLWCSIARAINFTLVEVLEISSALWFYS